MSRLKPAVVIALLLAAICTFAVWKTSSINERVSAQLEEIIILAGAEDESLESRISEIVDEWEKHEHILSCYSGHEELEQVSVPIEMMKEFGELGEKEGVILSCREAILAIEHLWKSEKPLLRNIL